MAPTKTELQHQNFGNLNFEKFEQFILLNIPRRYKDPQSVKIQFFKPIKKAWYRNGLAHGRKLSWGFMGTINVNAKNSYGGYTGYKKQVYWVSGDGVTFANCTNNDINCGFIE